MRRPRSSAIWWRSCSESSARRWTCAIEVEAAPSKSGTPRTPTWTGSSPRSWAKPSTSTGAAAALQRGWSGRFCGWQGRRCRGAGRAAARVHLARTVEEDSSLDHDGGGGQRPAHLRGGLQLHAFGGLGVAVVVADHDQRADLDLALHVRALADDEGVAGDDLARELAVDPDAPLEQELSLEGAALSEQGIQLARPRASARGTATASSAAAEGRRPLPYVFLAHRHRRPRGKRAVLVADHVALWRIYGCLPALRTGCRQATCRTKKGDVSRSPRRLGTTLVTPLTA